MRIINKTDYDTRELSLVARRCVKWWRGRGFTPLSKFVVSVARKRLGGRSWYLESAGVKLSIVLHDGLTYEKVLQAIFYGIGWAVFRSEGARKCTTLPLGLQGSARPDFPTCEKAPPPPKPPVQQARYEKVLAKIRRLEPQRARLEKRLRGLEEKKRYYERVFEREKTAPSHVLSHEKFAQRMRTLREKEMRGARRPAGEEGPPPAPGDGGGGREPDAGPEPAAGGEDARALGQPASA